MDSTELSPWYIVDARVELSLTPLQIANGGTHARRAAEQQAFSTFFMRYNRQLGGIPVASQGPLRYPDGKLRLIGASPFAHVTAEATILLFAPEKGTTLTGRVTHIGPDHIGLTVMRSFHSVLPLSDFYDGYRLHSQKKEKGGLDRFWKHAGGDSSLSKYQTVSLGTWIKFSVKGVRGTKAGLFDICGTLKVDDADERGLGFVPPEDENEEHPVNSILHGETNGIEGTNKTRPLRRRLADDALFTELDTFNDEFADMLDHADQAPLGSLDNTAINKNATDSIQKQRKSSNGSMEEGSKKNNKKKMRPKNSSDPFANETSQDAENGIGLTETMHEILPLKDESVLAKSTAKKKKKRSKTDGEKLYSKKKKKKDGIPAGDEIGIELSTPSTVVKNEASLLSKEKLKKSKKKRKKSIDKDVNS